MDSASISPETWLWMPKQYFNSTPGSAWPFSNISKIDFLNLQSSLNKDYIKNILRIPSLIIASIGILCSPLLIGSVWRKAIKEKNDFYIAMLIIAIIDLIFNLLSLAYSIWYRPYQIDGSTNFVSIWILIFVRGLQYTFSLASDICTIAVTFERYLSISNIPLHKLIFTIRRKITCRVLGSLIFLVSIIRMHSSFSKKLESSGKIYFIADSDFSKTKFYNILSIFSDVVIPFVLLCTMVVVSSLFRKAILKVWKKKKEKSQKRNAVAPTSPIDTTNPICAEAQNHDFRSMIILTVALDALFILNQIGYFCFYVGELFLAKNEISYESNSEEIMELIWYNQWENYADLASTVAECLARALNFPLFLLFSETMRKEFREFVRKLF